MINHFTIKTKMCKIHHLPEAFICTDPLCKYQSVLCSNCAKNSHSHYQNVFKIQDFIQHFSESIRKERDAFERQKTIVNVAAIVKSKKQEIEQKQLEILEHMMKRLSDEKKIIFQSLDLLEKAYLSKENVFKKNLAERSQIISYLTPYAESSELLELKLLCSSEWGIVNLKNNLLDLNLLSKQHQNRNIDSLTQVIMKEADKRVEGTFMQSLKTFILSYFMKSPPSPLVRQQSQYLRQKQSQYLRQKISSQHNIRPISTERKNQSLQAIPRMLSPHTPSSPTKRFSFSRALE